MRKENVERLEYNLIQKTTCSLIIYSMIKLLITIVHEMTPGLSL